MSCRDARLWSLQNGPVCPWVVEYDNHGDGQHRDVIIQFHLRFSASRRGSSGTAPTSIVHHNISHPTLPGSHARTFATCRRVADMLRSSAGATAFLIDHHYKKPCTLLKELTPPASVVTGRRRVVGCSIDSSFPIMRSQKQQPTTSVKSIASYTATGI